MSRTIARILVVLCFLLVTTLTVSCGGSQPVRYDKGTFRFDWTKHKDVSHKRRREIERQLDRNMQLLQVKMQDSAILEAVHIGNKRDRNITAQQIEALDKKWQESGEELPARLTSKKCNESLKLFQRTFKGFAEIFVTSARGLNVCQTNKTTDFYQADEDWWKRTFKHGKSRQARPEFDQSAGVFAVPIYVPVRDPATGNVIGVSKAVVLEHRR